MNRIPTLIKTHFNKLKPHEKVMTVGGASGGALGWGIAVNEASKGSNNVIDAMFLVPTFTAIGAACGAIFPLTVPTYAAIKGLQWLRPREKYDWQG
jgi:hypothetical protein